MSRLAYPGLPISITFDRSAGQDVELLLSARPGGAVPLAEASPGYRDSALAHATIGGGDGGTERKFAKDMFLFTLTRSGQAAKTSELLNRRLHP